MKNKTIVWFEEVGKEDIARVGGKGANLGEMVNAGIPVPYGFIVTADAYYQFIKETGLEKIIRNYLSFLNFHDSKSLQETAANIQKTIMKASMPKEIARAIMHAYLELPVKATSEGAFHHKLTSLIKVPFVAVRSSATAEDLPTASFAGQQATFLNIRGEVNVVHAVQEAWASLFTARAIFYREEQKFSHLKVGIAVPVQLMVNSESSGIMFTADPLTNDKGKITIEAIFGLGELIVQGEVTPDHFNVDKKTLAIEDRKIATQTKQMVKKDGRNAEVRIDKKAGIKQKVSDEMVRKIAKIGLALEKHYFFPQDVEWAIEKGNIYVVQTRPITTLKTTKEMEKVNISRQKVSDQEILLKGDPASPGIACGPVKIILNVVHIDRVSAGDILVTEQTNPDFVPAMKKAVAIITERGGRTSHAAIVSRELGIPAVVGVAKATKILKDGMVVTVNGAAGEIYKGSHVEKMSAMIAAGPKLASEGLKTATKVYVNLATPNPKRVEEVGKMNVDGVGLLRAEFMIADIGTHPKKLIHDGKQRIFIDKLADDLLLFCKAFNPRPVVYRATDFKTNEYRGLIGGRDFEPEEPNPMLGFRGAYRYIADPQVFNLELEAIKKVRNKLGYKNLWLMLPFVRSVSNLINVKKIIAGSGLSRSSSFKLWMMVEIPSNVILIDKFCEAGIDGVSIGSNDLTMLTLGTDRDNTEVASEFDERNQAVLWSIERVVKTTRKYGVTSSICGQAPSDYPDLVEDLVKWGITSMSVNPDAVDNVRETVYQAEKKLVKSR